MANIEAPGGGRWVWYICTDPTVHERPKSFWVAKDELDEKRLSERRELSCPYCEAQCTRVPEKGLTSDDEIDYDAELQELEAEMRAGGVCAVCCFAKCRCHE